MFFWAGPETLQEHMQTCMNEWQTSLLPFEQPFHLTFIHPLFLSLSLSPAHNFFVNIFSSQRKHLHKSYYTPKRSDHPPLVFLVVCSPPT